MKLLRKCLTFSYLRKSIFEKSHNKLKAIHCKHDEVFQFYPYNFRSFITTIVFKPYCCHKQYTYLEAHQPNTTAMPPYLMSNL